jgi:hypothetical protein
VSGRVDARRDDAAAISELRAMTHAPSDDAPDATADACAAWLVRQAEHHRLTLEWQDIETQLCDTHDWLNLSDDQRKRLPEHRTLEKLDARIRVLYRQNQKALRPLCRLVAATPRAISRKLEIALVVVRHDEDDAHRLVKSILRDFRALYAQ